LLNDRAVDPEQLTRKRRMRTISGVLPPREFGRPYPLNNLLIVERYASEAEVRLAGCRKSKPLLSGYLACSWANLASWSEERKMLVTGCRIVMASDEPDRPRRPTATRSATATATRQCNCNLQPDWCDLAYIRHRAEP